MTIIIGSHHHHHHRVLSSSISLFPILEYYEVASFIFVVITAVIDDLLASGTTIQPAVSSESFTDLLSSSHVDPKLFDSLPMSTSSSLSSPKQANKKTPPRTKPRPTRPKVTWLFLSFYLCVCLPCLFDY